MDKTSRKRKEPTPQASQCSTSTTTATIHVEAAAAVENPLFRDLDESTKAKDFFAQRYFYAKYEGSTLPMEQFSVDERAKAFEEKLR